MPLLIILVLVIAFVALLSSLIIGFILVRNHRRLPKSCPCSDIRLLLRYMRPDACLTSSELARVRELLAKVKDEDQSPQV